MTKSQFFDNIDKIAKFVGKTKVKQKISSVNNEGGTMIQILES
jgi:hypothetical protein